MIFHADITFALALIALASGALLILLAKTKSDIITAACRVIGFIIIVISVLILLCSGHDMIKKHIFKHAMMPGMMHRPMMRRGMRPPPPPPPAKRCMRPPPPPPPVKCCPKAR